MIKLIGTGIRWGEDIIHAFALSMILLPVSRASAQDLFWKQCQGPYGGGQIKCIAFDSTGKIYAAVSGFGIYCSTDEGTSWNLNNTGLTDFNIEAITALPGGTMLAATFSGVYRLDGPSTGWSLVNTEFRFDIVDSSGIWVSSLAYGPNGLVYAGTGEGLMKSSDRGYTRSPVFSGSYPVYSLDVTTRGYIYAGYQSSVALSMDSGSTWTGFGSFFDERAVGSIATMPNGDVVVSTSRNGITIFNAAGDTVRKELGGGGIVAVCTTPASNGWGDLYVGTYDGLYKLTADSSNWKLVPIDTENNYITALVTEGGIIMAGTSTRGIFRSVNYGATWTHPTMGISAVKIQSLTVVKPKESANPAGYVLAATEGNGIYRSIDNGNSWFSADEGINAALYEGTFLSVGPTGNLYTLFGYSIMQSTDAGVTWDSLSGAPSLAYGVWSLDTRIPGDSVGLLLATGESGIFISADGGTTWSYASTDYGMRAFAILPDSLLNPAKRYLFAGGNYNVSRSSDNGTDWELDISGMTNFYAVTSFFVPSLLNRTRDPGYIYAATYNGIYVSTDYGTHWNFSGLAGNAVTSIVGRPDGFLFAGTQDSGAYRMNPSTGAWTSLNSGLTGSDVSCIVIDSLGYLYAATESGLFRSTSVLDEIDRGPSPIADDFHLFQNYPNPFNPATQIAFSLPKRGKVTLRIYDMLGRLVSTLIDAYLDNGNHAVIWDAGHFPSGVYMAVLQSDGLLASKKLMLLK